MGFSTSQNKNLDKIRNDPKPLKNSNRNKFSMIKDTPSKNSKQTDKVDHPKKTPNPEFLNNYSNLEKRSFGKSFLEEKIFTKKPSKDVPNWFQIDHSSFGKAYSNLSANSLFGEDSDHLSKSDRLENIALSLYDERTNKKVKVCGSASLGKNGGERQIQKDKPQSLKLEVSNDQENQEIQAT